jgi:NADH:ubiquinone oxidoreductase subunit 5 (subunit L)/multisubunit Na+/H+ antiporter MnhA subunit
MIWIGGLTAVFAGTVGLTQFDIKKVIAYSTCSQLGYMILICGLASVSVSLFHLFNHAFFKAVLFIGAGSIIHAASDEQDMRKYGSISMLTPFLCIVFYTASMALTGLPFLSGFYSKDAILEILVANNSNLLCLWGYWSGLAAAVFTVAYSLKIYIWSFFSKTTKNFKSMVEVWHSISSIEIIVIFILILLSILGGFLFKDCFIGLGGNFFQSIVHINTNYADAEFLPAWIKLIPFISFIVVALIYIYIVKNNILYKNLVEKYKLNYNIFTFLNNKWYFNLIQNKYIVLKILDVCYFSFWVWDRLILEQLNLNKRLAK